MLRPWLALSQSTALLCCVFMTTSCAQDKKDDPTSPSDSRSSMLLALSLEGSRWEQCDFRFSHTESDNPSANVSIYVKKVLEFKTPTTGQVVAQYFATDRLCSQQVSVEEVIELTKGEVDELRPIETDELTFKIGGQSSDSNTIDLDMIFPYQTQYNGFYLAKLTPTTIEIADRCFDQDYVAEGLCQAVDGNSPDNRAKTFGMFGDEDRNIFIRVE